MSEEDKKKKKEEKDKKRIEDAHRDAKERGLPDGWKCSINVSEIRIVHACGPRS